MTSYLGTTAPYGILSRLAERRRSKGSDSGQRWPVDEDNRGAERAVTIPAAEIYPH
jgi:hypothetical protein